MTKREYGANLIQITMMCLMASERTLNTYLAALIVDHKEDLNPARSVQRGDVEPHELAALWLDL